MSVEEGRHGNVGGVGKALDDTEERHWWIIFSEVTKSNAED